MFTINNTPIKTVDEFKYLGRILDKNDNDWPAVCHAIKRAQIVWIHLRNLTRKDKADPKTMTSTYKAVVQAILLYGAESWVLSYGENPAKISPTMCTIYYRETYQTRPN
jgi:hypothetical protein